MPKQTTRLTSDGISTPETLSRSAQDVNTSSADSIFTTGRTHLEAHKAWSGYLATKIHVQNRAHAIHQASSALRAILSLISEAPSDTLEGLSGDCRGALLSHLEGIAFDIELMSADSVWETTQGVLQ